MAAALAPSMRDVVEAPARRRGASLEELASTITASFENSDLTNLNLAALPGTIGACDTATVFSTSTGAGYASTAAADWFAKVARARG
jgi:hypothetical protein